MRRGFRACLELEAWSYLSLQLRQLCLGLFQHRNIRIRVFPQRQEIFVSCQRPHPLFRLCASESARAESPAMAKASAASAFTPGLSGGGCGFGFALKPAQGLRVVRNVVGQEFESDKAREFDVLGLVHHSHSAAAEFLNDPVMGDGLAKHGCRSLSEGTPLSQCD